LGLENQLLDRSAVDLKVIGLKSQL